MRVVQCTDYLLTYVICIFVISSDDSQHILCCVCLVISALLAAFSILCCFITSFVYLRMTLCMYYDVFIKYKVYYDTSYILPV